ncbi:MAG: amino acid ABC transporter substrate-binding protein [Blautia sp.]|nr:amino acid ABC transporter substrate-binding protein [Blautia sp.]
MFAIKRKKHLYYLMLCCLALPLTAANSSAAETANDPPSAETQENGLPADETEEIYVENEWSYVDDSMDTSGGIPPQAEGRLGRIMETGVLRVATEPYFPPQEFIDPAREGQDRYVGADMELARLIAQRMGVELQIMEMSFNKVLEAAREGTCDLAISALAYTPGRAAVMEFSKGYYFPREGSVTGLLIREEDKDLLTDTQALADKNLIAQSGSIQEALLADNVLRYSQFRRVESMQQVYSAVEDGTADAGAADMEAARMYIENNPDCGLILMDGVHYSLEEQYQGDRVAAAKGELQLIYFVNGVIDEVTDSGIYDGWYEEYSHLVGTLETDPDGGNK